jgi:hypothetical protein
VTNDQIQDLAYDALTAAVQLIQDRLGVTTGDCAGIVFSDDLVQNLLADYICAEIMSQKEITQ